jgi:signal transduction histidine kinase
MWKDVVRGTFGAFWTMCEDRAGAYWAGSDTGVLRYRNGVVTHYTTKDGLAGDDTKVIIPDAAGGLWLGSYGGLTYYKDGKFVAWTERDGLPGATVRALKQDADGSLWIGTYDSGLGRFKDGHFTRYTKKDGLYDDGVFQILEDDSGWFWMSCNRGIYRVRKQELNDFADGKIKTITSLAYNQSDGMPSAECNGGRWPAGVKTRDGKLWFPTMGGVAMIDPASIRTNMQPPPVVIEEMRINNQPVALESWESAIRSPQSAIRVEPGQENFEIQYTALSFINSENLRFKYKLEGGDHDWVDPGVRRTAYYSHVAPGDYVFTVVASNSDGVWNTTGASLRITIVPRFWQTWWFYLLVMAGFTGGAVLAYRLRVAKLEREREAQEAFSKQLLDSQERERGRIAAELHDGLGQDLLIIKNRALVGLNLKPADESVREQLEEISTATSAAIEGVRDISWNLRPYQLDELGLSKAIESIINRASRSSEARFTHEIDDLDKLFEPESEINLYRIVQECINNILKHSKATEARVIIRREASNLSLTVSDNGQGFDLESLAAQEGKQGPRGFGMTGLTERARMLGGRLSVQSAPGQGTTVSLTITRTGS